MGTKVSLNYNNVGWDVLLEYPAIVQGFSDFMLLRVPNNCASTDVFLFMVHNPLMERMLSLYVIDFGTISENINNLNPQDIETLLY